MKKPTTSKLKKELDKWFSLYIRNKHSKNGMCVCYTCGAVKEIKHIQNGHFIARSYLATRFDENNCRPQCVGCNMFGKGKPLEFEERLKKELGAKRVEDMKRKRNDIVKYYPYETEIERYKNLVKELSTV
jgi:hypothetical protein